jgi:OOP family OmpA-OmpF porin
MPHAQIRLACLAALAMVPATIQAQDAKNQGYLVDSQNAIVRAIGAGVCVRTSDWTPARAVAECDPELARKPVPAKPPTPRATAPTPKVAPAPPPARKEPVKLVPQKIEFSADALFDFDRAELKPEGRAMLDELLRTLQGAQYEVILAIGHADRIGSAGYNQKLSVRRAQTVKNYLNAKGIEPNRVYVDGKGETRPVTKAADCRGKHGKTLIACLQPDRRVDVEVTATRPAK